MRVPVEVEMPAPVINIALPENAPLMCDRERASALFGISPALLDNLRKVHPDLPVKHIGRSVLYLVPDLYAWFRAYPGETIPTK